ncbi:tetratricopeptide repeat protein [Weissella confusa]|uniref:tetratricopeptide repeat protein n=1 Tax=Weissella confusa TaxID=1583 RepID=UPI0035A31742
MSTEDQVRLFNQYYDGDKVNQDTLEEILHRIGGHTMMIELLAKYAETTYDSLDHVLAMLKQKGIEALDSPVDTIHGYAFHKQETIQETVKWLFDVSELSDTEKRLLSLLAQLPTAGFKAPDFNKATNNVFRADLNELKNRSWIHIEHWMISVHPLIREAVNDYHLLKFNDVIGLVTFVKEKMQGDITLSEVNDYASMVANLVRNVEYDDNEGWGEFDEIADLLADKHAYGTLPSIYTELIKKRPDDDNYLRIVDAYKRVGKFAAAIKMDQEYIEFASSPDQYTQRADADTEIGNLYRKQGDYENAKKYFEDALQEFEGKSTDSLIYADIYNQRGIMYVNLDRLDEAEADYIKSLKIRKASKAGEPEKTEQIAYSNRNLGTVFQKRFEKDGQLEDLNRAILYHTTALKLRNDRSDRQLDQIGQSYTQLGRDYALKKDWENAEANLKRGLEVRIEQYGDIENNEIAWANFGLGEMYHNAGDNQTALIYAKKAYDIRNDASDVDKNFQYIVESGVLLVKIYSALGSAKEANDMAQLVEKANKQVKNTEKANTNLEKLQEAVEIE